MERTDRLIAIATVVGLPFVVLIWKGLFASRHPYPPGPKPHFILGNLKDFPKRKWYDTFTEWQKHYGDLVYLTVMGRPFIIINSLEDARELLVKRGNIYSGRGQPAIGRLVQGYSWNISAAEPGPYHTAVRGMFHKGIGTHGIADYEGIIEEESRNLVQSLRDFQGDPYKLIYSSTSAIVITVAYGRGIYKQMGKELVELNTEAFLLLSSAGPKFWSVNFIEWLHYLPDWLPLEFKRIGKIGTVFQKKIRHWAWEETVKHFNAGIAEQSVALKYLEQNKDLDVVRDGLAIMFFTGIDNTAASVAIFLTHMFLHPDVQKKVHEELDTVIARGHLPTFEDRVNLPYLDAAWRESRRLHPPIPINVQHVSQKADVYKDMYIPKKAHLFANLGFMCRDPRIFDNPDAYMPDRWLPDRNPKASSLPDVEEIIFGFGRRVCPGQHLADRTGFVFIATVLKSYDIVPIPGEVVPKEFDFLDAAVRHPLDFRCKFIPRV